MKKTLLFSVMSLGLIFSTSCKKKHIEAPNLVNQTQPADTTVQLDGNWSVMSKGIMNISNQNDTTIDYQYLWSVDYNSITTYFPDSLIVVVQGATTDEIIKVDNVDFKLIHYGGVNNPGGVNSYSHSIHLKRVNAVNNDVYNYVLGKKN